MNIIRSVGKYVPNTLISNYEAGKYHDTDGSFITSKIGFETLSRMSTNDNCFTLAEKACKNLLLQEKLDLEAIDLLILVTQNPAFNGIPHNSSILHDALGLKESCQVFDLSLGCTGFVHGLLVADSLMQTMRLENAILVTSDPYSQIINNQDKNTSMLFGDAATATLICQEGPGWKLTAYDYGTRSRDWEALNCTSGKLKMNGRSVFEFAAKSVPQSINQLLSKTNTEVEEIDLFLFHQGSRYIVETIAKRVGVAEDKFLFGSSNYGNSVSSSIPLLLNQYSSLLNNKNKIIASGFGVGLSWATCILEKV